MRGFSGMFLKLNFMNENTKRILSETSKETKQKAVEYGEKRKNCKHPREQRSYIGKNLLRCDVCGLEFS